jgi:hypothetical protein
VATIIDSLVIELGLDASKLDEGQRNMVGKLRQLESATQAHLQPVEKGFNNLIGVFKEFQGRLLGIAGLIAGGIGLDRLVGDLARVNAQTGYLAKSLNLTTKELTAWQAAGRTMGVSPDDSISGLVNLRQMQAERSLKGTGGLYKLSSSYPQLSKKLTELGPDANPTSVARALAEWAEKEEKDPNRARLALQDVGMSQGNINMLLQGVAAFDKMMKEAQKFGVTDDQVKNFQELTKAFAELTNQSEKLTRIIVSELTPGIVHFIEILSKLVGALGPNKEAQERADKKGDYPRSIFGRAQRWWKGGGFRDPPASFDERFSGDGSGASAPGNAATPDDGSLPAPPGGRAGPATPGGAAPPSSTSKGNTPSAGGPPPSAPAPKSGSSPGAAAPNQGGRPFYMGGVGNMEGYGKFHWGSGGAGKGSIPYGDWPITPGEVGPWGKAHGAVGLNHNWMPDPKMGPRSGIEIHASSSEDLEHMRTLGCFAVPQKEWPAFKKHLLGEIARNGPMYLHVGPKGATLDHNRTLSSSTVDFGAAKRRLQNGAGGNTHNNTKSSQTNIGSMHVTVPSGADPGGYADGIREHLQRNDPVLNSMTGMN